MSDTPDLQNNSAASPSLEELVEVIEQFEQYRERLLNDSMETAKRAKIRKSDIMAQIEPELSKIDTALEQLRAQHANLTSA